MNGDIIIFFVINLSNFKGIFNNFHNSLISHELWEIARSHIKNFSERFVVINKLFDDAIRFVVINKLFDDAIDDFLHEGLSGIDIADIDGHHEKLATLHYFERIKPMLNPDSVVIFDDIYWSKDMYDAELKSVLIMENFGYVSGMSQQKK